MARWNAVLLGLAGLIGAAGVALAAVAAHLAGGAMLATAADFLLFHAAGGAALTARGPAAGRRGTALLAAASLMIFGAVLFAGDLAMRQLAGTTLLWGTAPVGGTLTILGWLAVAAAALLPAA